MKHFFLELQTKLAEVSNLRYIDKNWNQLNFEQPPVQFPCVLIDIINVDYTQMGKLHQNATAEIEITVCDQKLTNSSHRNPNREKAFSIFETLDNIHQTLQGYSPANVQPLFRTNLQKVDSNDKYECYRMTYRTGWKVEKLTDTTSAHVEPVIEDGFIDKRFNTVQ